jgi:rod shape-determining protein MreD
MTPSARLGVRLVLLAIGAVLLQTALVGQVELFGARPDLAPLVVASIGLLCGAMVGAVSGFAVGLLVDLALVQTLGVSSLTLCVVGHLAGRLRETARDPGATMLPLPAGAAATALYVVLFSLLYFLLGVEAPISLELVRQIVLTILINTLLALPVHALVRRALGRALEPAAPAGRRRARPGLSPLQQA